MVEMGLETTKSGKGSKWVSKAIKSLLGGFLSLWLKYQRNASIISKWCKTPMWPQRGLSQALAMQLRVNHTRKNKKPLKMSRHNQAQILQVKPPRVHNLPYKVTTSKALQTKMRETQEWWHAHKAKHIQKVLHNNIGPLTTPILQPKSATKLVNQHLHYVFISQNGIFLKFVSIFQFFNFLIF